MLDLGWVDGKRKRKPVYGTTRTEVVQKLAALRRSQEHGLDLLAPPRTEVVQKLAALRRSQEHGLDLLAPPRTVGAWLGEWLSDLEAQNAVRPTTLARYRSVVGTHLVPGLGRHKLDKLAPPDVQQLLGSLSGRLSPGTVGKVHAVLRSALSDAERLDLVERNVAKVVRPPSIPRVERWFLTVAEAQDLLHRVEGDRLEAFFVIALTLGLRRGEVLGLKRTDLDSAAGTLRVVRALQRAGGELRTVEPKTARARRLLPLPSVTRAAIDRQRARQAADRLAAGPGWLDLGFVFTTSIGTPLEPRNVNRRFQELRSEAGLEWLRLHDLRHGCATFLLASGVEPRTVMEVLGHSTYRLTMDLYGHALPERMRSAADVMDQAMRRSS